MDKTILDTHNLMEEKISLFWIMLQEFRSMFGRLKYRNYKVEVSGQRKVTHFLVVWKDRVKRGTGEVDVPFQGTPVICLF